MGCSGSKVDDLPLVIRCRERRDLIKAAADHRYALAAAHLSYFRSLKGVGDALRKFVEEELVVGASSSSTTTAASSPVVTLHSLDDDEEEHDGDVEAKRNKKIKGNYEHQGKLNKRKPKNLSSDDSGSGDSHVHHGHRHDDDSDSHVHLSSDDDSDANHHRMHHHGFDSEDENIHAHHDSGPYPNRYGYGMLNEPPPGYAAMYGMPPGYGMMNELPPGYGMMNAPPPEAYWGPFPSYFGPNEPYQAWEPPTYENPDTNFRNTNVYYMKKSSPVMRTVIHEAEPMTNGFSHSYFSQPFESERFYGYPMGPHGQPERGLDGRKQGSRPDPPPPPSPKVSTWDFLNPFDAYDSGYAGYYAQYGYGKGSSASSPDSTEVRKREGIPDLEEETENEVSRDAQKGKRVSEDVKRSYAGEGTSGSRPVPLSSEDSSKRVPLRKNNDAGYRGMSFQTSAESNPKDVPFQTTEGSAKQTSSSQRYKEGSLGAVPSDKSEATGSINLSESSSDSILSSKSPEDVHVKKKEVSFEVDETLKHEIDSSKLSSLTTLSPHGTRDLREVVAEIRDEFAVASDNGKEVALMLEVGKVPYQPNFIRVVLSRVLYLMSPSLSTYPVSRRSVRLAAKTMKMAKSYFGDINIAGKPCNLSCTLEKLYAWEKKLYKEVKDEERLRVIYEKLCKRLRTLDEQGAESSKIEPVRASIRKLLTKLNICIKTIGSISNRIDKLRDEELQPQVAELIHGLIRMWKSMFRCHQKQFQAIMESKVRALKANTSFQKEDSGLRATLELEMELRTWLGHFNNWISTQKSYVESLNGWLLRCLLYEPEETADGPAPFSPGRLGAPPVFVICNDWYQAMGTISETTVANAMNNFASSLRELWEKQDEEQRQRLNADDLSKDFKDQLKTVHMDKKKAEREKDTMSDRNRASIVPSKGRVSRLDDLKVDLDTVGKRLAEEKARHRDAVKIVHDAASSSVQGGLVPIFKALESFSLEVLKAHEQVRLRNGGQRL